MGGNWGVIPTRSEAGPVFCVVVQLEKATNIKTSNTIFKLDLNIDALLLCGYILLKRI
jgi:hypothetical protein